MTDMLATRKGRIPGWKDDGLSPSAVASLVGQRVPLIDGFDYTMVLARVEIMGAEMSQDGDELLIWFNVLRKRVDVSLDDVLAAKANEFAGLGMGYVKVDEERRPALTGPGSIRVYCLSPVAWPPAVQADADTTLTPGTTQTGPVGGHDG